MINKLIKKYNELDFEENVHWIIMTIAILGIVLAFIMRNNGYMGGEKNEVVDSSAVIVDTLNIKQMAKVSWLWGGKRYYGTKIRETKTHIFARTHNNKIKKIKKK